MSRPIDDAAAAASLLTELVSSRLEVARCGTLRIVVSENCEWYRRFCSMFAASRKRYPKPRTIIKRSGTIRALQRIADGGDLSKMAAYVDRLRPFIAERKEMLCFSSKARKRR